MVESNWLKNLGRKENNVHKERKDKKVESYVTKGRAEDYDIEKVLQDLKDDPKKPKKKKKSKKKQLYYLEPKPAKETEKKTDSQGSQEFPDCTICYCPREKTFMLEPCGHATFCEDCTERIRKGRCPNCQAPIIGTRRIYQDELPK